MLGIGEVTHDAVIAAAIAACALVLSSLIQSRRGFRRNDTSQTAIRKRQNELHDLMVQNRASIDTLTAMLSAHLSSSDEESNTRREAHEETMQALGDSDPRA